MSEKTPTPYPSSKLRFIDVLVLIVFTFTAIFGLYLFQQDLMRSIELMDVDPAGIIIIRNNIIQRRHENRSLWERLFVDSPVYPGDLIRAAEQSSASIDIENNDIFLSENTLIRIQSRMDGTGSFQVELQEGNISVSSGADSGGITLNLMGQSVHARSGAVLDLSAGADGINVQVNEGTAELIQNGQSRPIAGGSVVSFDAAGVERVVPTIVMRRPWNNARYLNSVREKFIVDFEWSRLNIAQGEALRLEISGDFDFKNIVNDFTTTANSAQAALDLGQWYWRVSYNDAVLRRGWVTIVDSSGPALSSPANGSLFRYRDNYVQLRFQWTGRQHAVGYLIEIGNAEDFSSPFIRRQTSATSLIISELGQGTWYWRVSPVFQSVFSGESGFSRIGSFRIDQLNAPLDTSLDMSIEEISAIELPPVIKPEPLAVTRPEPVRVQNRESYTVRPGDTLGRIANRYYNDPMQWGRIAEANNIRNPDLIYPGQVFIIP
ncbi:MAG: LysM peptidoglycan-binding domain-containing protein [Treponema sp.]|nr:LysM peptidoglycan-binding domain-containing protein [Treponema sp.]MCL2237382.1 LysM peptidoglycan-binding domain-containing protein [Treponema sp.]